MQIKHGSPHSRVSNSSFVILISRSYTYIFVYTHIHTREHTRERIQANWNHSIYRCINNVADAKCKRSLRKFGSWITFPTPHFFPCCTLNEVRWYAGKGREPGPLIQKIPIVESRRSQIPPLPLRYPPFSRINLSRMGERFRIWFLLSF